MNIHHIRNIHFTKLLKVNGRVREFNFRKIPNATDLFHLDVSDDRGNRIIFKMQKEDNHWRIVPQELPQWLIDSEKRLGELIDEELSISY
jgi:hypothetical protein